MILEPKTRRKSRCVTVGKARWAPQIPGGGGHGDSTWRRGKECEEWKMVHRLRSGSRKMKMSVSVNDGMRE